jgi:hypothetical protein
MIREGKEALLATLAYPEDEFTTKDLGSLRPLLATLSAVLKPRAAYSSNITSTTSVHMRDLTRKEPRNWKELVDHPLYARFKKGAQDEIDALRKRDTWEEVPRTEATGTPLPLKWVFAYKFDKNGYLDRCKARICVRGDLQEEEQINNTYAATLTAHTFRVMIALAAYFDLEIKQFDIKNAYLNTKLDEQGAPIYCELPDGFKRPGIIARLKRALYGLKEAPALWYAEFAATLAQLGLAMSSEDPCLFYSKDRKLYIIFFVDDILLFYHKCDQAEADRFVSSLLEKYECHDCGDAQWFLGIQIIRDRAQHKTYLSHATYIDKIARKFKLDDQGGYPVVPISATELPKYEGVATPAEVKIYQELVGSLLYTAIMIRADVAFAASFLSRSLTNPGPEHLKAVRKAIRYLFLTKGYALCFGGIGEMQALFAASDASYADDLETRRSSQGYLISLFGGLIMWKATRQSTVTTSTTEAELLALSETARQTVGLQRLFYELHFDPEEKFDIRCDNQQTIRLVLGQRERIQTRLRHVDVHNMWLRERAVEGAFDVTFLPTAEMPADGLTKALPRQRFEPFRAMLNLTDISQEQ